MLLPLRFGARMVSEFRALLQANDDYRSSGGGAYP
jgi:hypothetical protein